MSRKTYIGNFLPISFTDRKEIIKGLVIDYTDDWLLMKYNPVDYVIDGYVIIRNKNLKAPTFTEKDLFTEKVLKLKNQTPKKEEKIPLTDLKTILTYLSDTFGAFQLDTKSEKACYLGKFVSMDSKKLIIDFLDPKGEWSGQISFRPDDVRVIEYNTDYINSLKLVSEQQKQKA